MKKTKEDKETKHETIKYTLIYFKPNGTYYSEGEYTTQGNYWKGIDEIKNLIEERKLPGLMHPNSRYHVLIESVYAPELIPIAAEQPSFLRPLPLPATTGI